MRKFFTLTFFFAALLLTLVSCKKEPQIIEVISVTLNKTTLTLLVDDKETLTATIAPTNATDKSIIWSSDKPSIAKVDEKSGEVTALSAGEAIIIAKSGTKTASCKVTVTVPVAGISLDKNEATLTEGSEITLVATLLPENATDKTVTWKSSNEAVATVDANGKVTAVAVGEATITATDKDGSKSANCKVTVVARLVAVESVSLDKTAADVILGETLQLAATITPKDATNKNIIWSSSDTAIATVDENGKVTAIKEGVATITVTTSDGGKTATCTVKVLPAPITAITITTANVTLKEGETKPLKVEFTPAGSTASKELEWGTSDDKVATISQEGVVTAVKEGDATIAVRLKSNSAITATCSVKVERDATLKGISLNSTTADLKEGETLQLEAIFNPTYAVNKTIKSWISSNPAVATVDQSGKVTAIAKGETTITATAEDGDFTATCTINVVEKGVDIYTIMAVSGAKRLYKNFEHFKQYTPNMSHIMQIDNGDLYYTSYYHHYATGSHSEVKKNDDKIADYTNEPVSMSVVNGTVYLVTCNYDVSPRAYHLHKINSDGTSHEINIPLAATAKSREFGKVVANAAGEVYILGQETDIFKETVFKLWKISSSEEVSETVFSKKTHYYSISDITTDSNGNAWVIISNNSNRSECYLYKNGVYHSMVATDNPGIVDDHAVIIRFKGGDRYIAYCSNTGINVLKNNSLLYTIERSEPWVYISDMDFSSNGDVYVALYEYTDNANISYVYKNTSKLYTSGKVQVIFEMGIME